MVSIVSSITCALQTTTCGFYVVTDSIRCAYHLSNRAQFSVSPIPSQAMDQQLASLVRQLFEIEALKFGDFTLKSGLKSPIYVNLRVLASHPEICNTVCERLNQLLSGLNFDRICGVPYTALVFASNISARYQQAMITCRKEMKAYGMKQMVDGDYRPGQRVVLIEDVISSGTSILETVLVLRRAGLKVTDAVVFLDRQQGGVQNLAAYDLTVHSVVKLEPMLHSLAQGGCLSQELVDTCLRWVADNIAPLTKTIINEMALIDRVRLSFDQRAQLEKVHPLNRRLFQLMAKKESNLCVSADLTNTEDILQLVQLIGHQIVILKLHNNIIGDFNQAFIAKLRTLANSFDFLLFEDFKFDEIGNTAALQFSDDRNRIVEWADLVTVHIAPGEGQLKVLKAEVPEGTARGCLLIAQMSNAGNLLPADSTRQAFKLAINNPDFVCGFIAQSPVAHDQAFVQLSPGVRFDAESDGRDQRYVSPKVAVCERGADVIIVGRGILDQFRAIKQAGDNQQLKDTAQLTLLDTVKAYREEGYKAYTSSLN